MDNTAYSIIPTNSMLESGTVYAMDANQPMLNEKKQPFTFREWSSEAKCRPEPTIKSASLSAPKICIREYKSLLKI